MGRWLALAIGLLVAAAAALALLTMGGLPDPEPHDDIDEASRQELRRLLQESRSE